MSDSSIWHIHRTLSVGTTPSQNILGSDGSESVLHIPIIEALTSGYLMSYPGHSLRGRGSYPYAEMKSYFTALANSKALKPLNQKYEYVAVQKKYTNYIHY